MALCRSVNQVRLLEEKTDAKHDEPRHDSEDLGDLASQVKVVHQLTELAFEPVESPVDLVSRDEATLAVSFLRQLDRRAGDKWHVCQHCTFITLN